MDCGKRELNAEQLEAVIGGVNNTAHYVEAKCEHCGAEGKHLKTSGQTALCRQCGGTINLKAQA